MMKKNLRFILLSFIIIPLISGCTSELGYYEDKLYSEKAFTDYKAELTVDQNSNILTREKAVEKVIGVFKEGLNKKIDRAAFSESIKLYRDSSDTAFKWQINWTDPST
ncbi:MAG: hypothetical protein Q8930_17180, partial [Bacillota bacterium]|nr:hypothetical protein [Bacillota bacterium]